MRPRFLADENFNAKIIAGLLRREPTIDFQTASAAGLRGLSDPLVLAIAAHEGRILVSHDRETMPSHFSRFITDSPSPGLLIVDQRAGLGDAIEQMLLIWACSDADEWIGRVGYLPL
jgi:hypothetical protein